MSEVQHTYGWADVKPVQRPDNNIWTRWYVQVCDLYEDALMYDEGGGLAYFMLEQVNRADAACIAIQEWNWKRAANKLADIVTECAFFLEGEKNSIVQKLLNITMDQAMRADLEDEPQDGQVDVDRPGLF